MVFSAQKLDATGPRKQLAMRAFFLLAVALVMAGPSCVNADAPPKHAPEFTGIKQWINSPPLTMAGLRGKVVLIDFWAYSCINCLREIPHVEHLYQTYGNKGLVVVGVHTPEFEVERNPANVKAAVRRIGISYPVALDNRNSTWKAWHNEYWPAEYVIDQTGKLVVFHYGEGQYEKIENVVRLLLGMDAMTKSVTSKTQ